MAKLSPIGNNAQFINGDPAVGAKLFFYAAGSSTKQTTYADEAGLIPQTNPIILDSRGEPAQPIWLTEGLSYKVVFTSSTDSDPPASPIWDIDDVTGVNDASLTIDQWIDSGVTPTYVSATQFTLPGDQTSTFTVGRRVKTLVTAGTAYGTIAASVFGALTTVTVVMDSTPLDSGLSSVQLGLITPTNGSLPYNLTASAIQKQTFTAFTTAGSSSVFTLTPFPALSSYTTDLAFFVTMDEAPTGSPTINISGLGAKNWKYYDSTGAKQFINSTVAPSGWKSYIYYDGTDVILLNPVPAVTTGSIPPSVRQTVLSGTVDTNGFAAFGGATGATTVTTSTTLTVTAANGTLNRTGQATNPSWTGLSTNGTMYLWADVNADGSLTTGSGTLSPTYRSGGADVVTNNQFTFNIQEMVGKVGNGTTATQTYRVYVGQVTVAGGVVTSITWYALMGRYSSPLGTTLPGVSTATSFAHNLGVRPRRVAMWLYCVTAQFSYVTGDYIYESLSSNATWASPHGKSVDTLNAIVLTQATAAWLASAKTGGNATNTLTAANFNLGLDIDRGW
jgi:hypothetical protein